MRGVPLCIPSKLTIAAFTTKQPKNHSIFPGVTFPLFVSFWVCGRPAILSYSENALLGLVIEAFVYDTINLACDMNLVFTW